MKLAPLAVISLRRLRELEESERRLRRLARLVMMVEHRAVSEERGIARTILFRAGLNDIPELLDYSCTGPGRTMRLFGLETLSLAPNGEGYDVLFMEP